MGIKTIVTKTAGKAADAVAKLSTLSPAQLQEIQENREAYLNEKPDPNDVEAIELTQKLLAVCGVEIFNAYLPQLVELYTPVSVTAEYDGRQFDANQNLRYIDITKWVTDKKENNLEKLVNVYAVLSREECNIALVFHRTCKKTNVYLAVTNTANSKDQIDVENYKTRLVDAIKGNFPGSEIALTQKTGSLPCMDNSRSYSVAAASNIPTEKSEKFVSQTIEKLLDGNVPEDKSKEYILILMATPILDVEERKLHLSDLYSALAPYANWSTQFTYDEHSQIGSSATAGLNVGASFGIQRGASQSESDVSTSGVSDSSGRTNQTGITDGTNSSETSTKGWNKSKSTTKGTTAGVNAGGSAGINIGPIHVGGSAGGHIDTSRSRTVLSGESGSTSKMLGRSTSKTISEAITNTITNTASRAIGTTSGVFNSVNQGVNFGANFARSSNVSATLGKSESITQNYTNYNIRHALELLEEQMKRYEKSTALGMWDFAAYVLSEDFNVANNVAHTYLALTQGEESYMSKSAINLWRGDISDMSDDAKEICKYLKELRHPIFGLDPYITSEEPDWYVYPAAITATTPLSGKELAYSLNFPQKSVEGLPVIECAEFGRNITSYDSASTEGDQIHIGKIFHMHHEERTGVSLTKQSLASHTFITGSTGSGKSNTVFKILKEAEKENVKFLVIEPAKGEYKHVFGNDRDVNVYGTNPAIAPMLRINPFSFPEGIHVLEHIDRLVEVFNVCWPMYAAMPAVLKSAIEKSYEDCGWCLDESTNEYGNDMYPTFADVGRNVKSIVETSEYDAENKGAYKGALLTRLQSLTNGINGMVFVNDELSMESLFDSNTIVDLSRVGSSETKSLLMGMLVLKLQEYRMSSVTEMNSGLKHITVLEEAHNLLKRTSTEQASESSNLLGKSVEMLSNAIAEMRTYGEGFIIADQAPGLLDLAAIRNTNTKIIMRLPDQADRELVGYSANLNDEQISELAKLPRGVAAVYQNEWIQPVLCKVERVDTKDHKYVYEPDKIEKPSLSVDERMEIVEILSKGTKIERDDIISIYKAKLDKIKMDPSLQVAVLRLLENPPEEPRMTKLSPIIRELLPEVYSAVKQSVIESSDEAAWTRSAERSLTTIYRKEIDEQVRRDIIQGIITFYLMIELNDMNKLEQWAIRGNLR